MFRDGVFLLVSGVSGGIRPPTSPLVCRSKQLAYPENFNADLALY